MWPLLNLSLQYEQQKSNHQTNLVFRSTQDLPMLNGVVLMAYIFTLTLLYLFPVEGLRVTDLLVQQHLTVEVSIFRQF